MSRPPFALVILAAAVLAAGAAPAATPLPSTVKLPEGYTIPVRIDDALSTRNSAEGDHFTITLAEAITLPDGTVLPEGYRGMGEVTRVETPKGFGKVGRLSVRLDYIRVGDAYVRLRAIKAAEGKGNGGNLVLGWMVGGAIGLALVEGHSARIAQGQLIQAVVDKDVQIAMPIPPPPQWN